MPQDLDFGRDDVQLFRDLFTDDFQCVTFRTVALRGRQFMNDVDTWQFGWQRLPAPFLHRPSACRGLGCVYWGEGFLFLVFISQDFGFVEEVLLVGGKFFTACTEAFPLE